MAHNAFTVQFADGKQLFGTKGGIGGQDYRQLFETLHAAWKCPREVFQNSWNLQMP